MIRLAVLILLSAVSISSAAEPSFFRRNSGIGQGNGKLPDDLSSVEPLWKQLLLPGNSSPCVCGDAIYLTTFDKENQTLATVALDRSTGGIRWTRKAPAESIEKFHPVGSPASSTVACDGERVFSFFGSFGLLCYDLKGTLLWSKPMGPFQDEFGASSSPVLVDGKVILNEDHDLGNFVVAIDAGTGDTVWKTPRPGFTRSYASPAVWKVDGRNQVVIAGALRLTAYDPNDGKPIWWVDGLSRIVDSTPVIDGNMLYLATWTPGGDPAERISMEPFPEALKTYDKNSDGQIAKTELSEGAVLSRFFRIDLNQNEKLDEEEWKAHARVFENAQNVAMAVRAGGKGDITDSHVAWLQRKNLPVVPSSLIYRNAFYMVKNGGILTSLDSADGTIRQQGRLEGRGNYYASLVAGDDVVYAASERGVVTVVKLDGKSWEVASSHDFGERIMATPVIVDGRLYLRTDDALYCYGSR